MASSSNPDWSSTYSLLTEYHNKAYKCIDEAITLVQEGKLDQAITRFEDGLINIDNALQLSIECPHNPDFTFEKACVMIQKMKEARKTVLSQIADCMTKLLPTASPSSMAAPPSYEEAMSNSMYSSIHSDTSSSSPYSTNTANSSSITYMELGNMLENLKIDIGAQSAQVIFQCDGVRVYYISSAGFVTSALQPDKLRIFELEDGKRDGVPKYYLQIGTYLYPLVANVSPCLRAEYGAILLPNVDSVNTGEVIGIVIPPEHEESVMLLLEDVLKIKLIHRQEGLASGATRLSTKISGYLTSGANVLSGYLVNGAQKADQFLNNNTPKLIGRLNQSREKRVSPKFRHGIKIARDVTATTASVTGFVATKVGSATMCLGRYLSPYIKKGGTKLLSTTTGIERDEASQKVDDVFTVTAGAFEGLAAVYESLEKSAMLLGRSLTNNTVQVVTHKYGQPAGEVTENTFFTVGNSLQIGNNMRLFKPNNLVKTTAMGTFVSQHNTNLSDVRYNSDKQKPYNAEEISRHDNYISNTDEKTKAVPSSDTQTSKSALKNLEMSESEEKENSGKLNNTVNVNQNGSNNSVAKDEIDIKNLLD